MDLPLGLRTRVTLYVLPGCNGARRVREYLARRHVCFEEVNILRQPKAIAHMESGYVDQLPVIRVGDRLLNGYDLRGLGGALRVLSGEPTAGEGG
jgi:glutaredoxin